MSPTTWFKVDDGLHAHPKILAAGNAALGLWVRAGSWSAEQLTNGFIPRSLARSYGSERNIQALVDAGLWVEIRGGFVFKDWQDWQPSEEEVAELKRKRSEAGKLGAAKRWGRSTPDGNSHSTSNGKPITQAIAPAIASAMANRYPDPDPVVGVRGNQSVLDRNARATTGLDLDKIAAELGQPRAWAERVANDIIARRGSPPTDPTAYVLAAIRGDPTRYQPTPGPPPVGRLCDHGRDRLTCIHCATEQP